MLWQGVNRRACKNQNMRVIPRRSAVRQIVYDRTDGREAMSQWVMDILILAAGLVGISLLAVVCLTLMAPLFMSIVLKITAAVEEYDNGKRKS
jgi:hypothetical protein